MTHIKRYTLLLTLAATITGCAASTHDAVSPNTAEKQRDLVCKDTHSHQSRTSARECIERGGRLL